MKIKKRIILFFSMFLILSMLVACNNKQGDKNIKSDVDTKTDTTEVEKEVEQEKDSTENIKAGDTNADEVLKAEKEEQQAKIEKNVQDTSIDIYSIVEMSIDKSVYSKKDKVKLSIKNIANLDDFSLKTTNAYTLEVLNKETWEPVLLNTEFEDKNISIEKEKLYEEEIDLSDLKIGSYRISKVINFSKSENEKDKSVVVLQKSFSIE